ERAGGLLLPQVEQQSRRTLLGERADGRERAGGLVARARRGGVGARRFAAGDGVGVEQLPDRAEDVLDLERLGEELRARLRLQLRDRRRVLVDRAGDDERHLGAVLVLAQLAREGEAVHARNEQVADDEVVGSLFERGEPLLSVADGDHFGVARGQRRLVRQQLLEDLADVLVVFDDQDA